MQTFPNVRLVGSYFRGAEAVEYVAALREGDTLQLELEPENQYDQNAIKVIGDGMHVGYIERQQAAWIAPAADGAAELSAVVTEARGRDAVLTVTVA